MIFRVATWQDFDVIQKPKCFTKMGWRKSGFYGVEAKV